MSWKELGAKKKMYSRSEWTVQKIVLWAKRPNRVYEEREVPAGCLGCLLELLRYWLKRRHQRGAGWRLQYSLVIELELYTFIQLLSRVLVEGV